MTIHVDIEIDIASVPFALERDEESGQFMAANDELRVAAVGRDETEATSNFRDAVAGLVEHEASAGRALPETLAQFIRQPA